MHHHHENGEARGKRLLITTVINFSFAVIECLGGFFSNSLSLISDSLHNLGDAFSAFLAFFANKIGERKSDVDKTFGYKRAEILVALLNSLALIAICIFLFVEAYERLLNPKPVKGVLMFVVALAGLLANLFSMLLLRRNSSDNLNLKAAYLHLLGDTFSSVLVIIGGIAITFWGIYWIDPLITFIVGIFLLKESYKVLKEAVEILMQAAPCELDLNDLKKEIELIPEISNIHHIHAWRLNDSQSYLECHIDLKDDLKVSESQQVKEKVDGILRKKFQLQHITVQFEVNSCPDKSMINHIVPSKNQ
ncbi:MAG: cation diffusion facilitator family transporter [Bacteroidota bacterium]|nr:cation diffusion facilitator family transporter [Bacteroidota bacterium]MDP4274442.1 cation diffusion facilitator family transporter [Bacteroidota bacterium]